MHRRNFFKLVGTASGGVMSGACGKQAEEIIPLLVPEDEIVPGVEEWHASVCQECGAACGTVARVMASEREIEVEGERLRQRIAAIKKLEGNPEDLVSGGRLCARGHSALQALYNPDRLTQPLKRVGERGSGRFEPVPWDVALDEASSALARAVATDPGRILFLAPPRAGSRAANIERFLKSVGAPSARSIGICDFAAEIEGARRAFGFPWGLGFPGDVLASLWAHAAGPAGAPRAPRPRRITLLPDRLERRSMVSGVTRRRTGFRSWHRPGTSGR